MNWTKEVPAVDGWYWIKDLYVHRQCFTYIKNMKFCGYDLNYKYGKENWEYLGPLEVNK